MFPEVLNSLIANAGSRMIPASLSGHIRVRLEGRSYPGLLKDDRLDGELLGLLIPLDSLSSEDLLLIDSFEGAELELSDVSVRDLTEDRLRRAVTYRLNEKEAFLAKGEWEADEWAKEHISRTMEICSEYRLEFQNERFRECLHILRSEREKESWDESDEREAINFVEISIASEKAKIVKEKPNLDFTQNLMSFVV